MKRKTKNNNVKLLIYYKNIFLDYIKFLPSFIKASGSAFLIDSLVFTFLRPTLGTNYSACISFLCGTITLFSVLRIFNESRIKRKRTGILVQSFIGLGSFFINLCMLNLFDYLFKSFDYLFYNANLNKSFLYAFMIRFLSACIGFIWTSTMTNKFTFTSKRRSP